MSGIVLSLLILIAWLPVVVEIGYRENKFSLKGKIWFIPVFRGSQGNKEVERESFSFLEKLPDWPLLRIFLKNAYTTLCRLAPRVWIPMLRLRVTVGGRDPADTALLYGAVGTAMEALSDSVSGRVDQEELSAEVDFSADRWEVSGCMTICLRLFQAVNGAVRFSLGAWRDYRSLKKGSMQKHDESAAGRYDGYHHG